MDLLRHRRTLRSVVSKEAQPCRIGPAPGAPARSSAELKALSPDRYRYQLTIGASMLEKLRFAKDMLRQALPSGDDEVVLDRALTSLIEDLARQRFVVAEKTDVAGETMPRSSRGPVPGSRHLPVAVKRAVWVRDLGRCAFVGASGHRCDERAFLQFHHVRPYEVVGEGTVDNIELRCGRHNRHEAPLYFPREPIDDGVPRGRLSHERSVGRTSSGTSAPQGGRRSSRRRASNTAADARGGLAQVRGRSGRGGPAILRLWIVPR
jgi:hypothetical protein